MDLSEVVKYLGWSALIWCFAVITAGAFGAEPVTTTVVILAMTTVGVFVRKVAHLNSLVSEAQAELKGVAERQALREKSLKEFLSITERSRDARSNSQRQQDVYQPYQGGEAQKLEI
tara:strand:- start:4469 stop:4819 length:351 start_codon:yes stop_codon:yes gene_type:complete